MHRLSAIVLLTACSSAPPPVPPTPAADPPFVRLLDPDPGLLGDQVFFGQAADGRVVPMVTSTGDFGHAIDDRLTGATSATGAFSGWTILGTTVTTSWSCATVSGTLLCKGDGVFGTIPPAMCVDNVSCHGWCSNSKPGMHKCVSG